MTLKVVAVLLAKVRLEMVTSAAGITSTIIQRGIRACSTEGKFVQCNCNFS